MERNRTTDIWKRIALVQCLSNAVLIVILLLGADKARDDSQGGAVQSDVSKSVRVHEAVKAKRFIICNDQGEAVGMFGTLKDGRPVICVRHNVSDNIALAAGINRHGMPGLYMYYPDKTWGMRVALRDDGAVVSVQSPNRDATACMEVANDGITVTQATGADSTEWHWHGGGYQVHASVGETRHGNQPAGELDIYDIIKGLKAFKAQLDRDRQDKTHGRKPFE